LILENHPASLIQIKSAEHGGQDDLMTARAALIYYLFLGGVGLSALAQIMNFVAGWPTRNCWRWIGLAFGIVAVLSLGIAGQMGKQDLQWRGVDDSQEVIPSASGAEMRERAERLRVSPGADEAKL
jgi:hypothetical protein